MRVKASITLVISLIILVASLLFVIAGDEMIVEANIIAPKQVVSIAVPDYFFFGDVNVGEESNRTKVEVNNTGNVNVTVTPRLEDSGEEIFSNLYFTKRLSGESYGWAKIGEFSMNITKPSTNGGVEEDYCYMKLDLTSYDKPLSGDMMGHDTKIKFYAVAQ